MRCAGVPAVGVDVAERKPLAIDLFCGLGGWTEGLLAEGYDVIGFDIERHEYGDQKYPAQLVIQDVLTLHGSQFKSADLIVASPPCQEFSYMAMPWSLAKEKRRKYLSGELDVKQLTALFNSCFRLQREACEARGGHIPMVVENVKGAQPWVGRARWAYGSYFLWGDVPALMPAPIKAQKFNPDGTSHPSGSWFKIADSKNRGSRSDSGHKNPGFRFDGTGKTFQSHSVATHIKVPTGGAGRSPAPGKGARFTSRDCGMEIADGRKGAGAGAVWFDQNLCQLSSKSSARKAASAMIAKIPLPLSRHIAATFRPREVAA